MNIITYLSSSSPMRHRASNKNDWSLYVMDIMIVLIWDEYYDCPYMEWILWLVLIWKEDYDWSIYGM